MQEKKKDKKIIIEWHSIFRDLRRNLIFIVMSVLIGLMGIFIVRDSMYSPEYSSVATLVVSAKIGNTNPYANLSVSSEMAKVFAEVFVQPSMRERLPGSLRPAGLGGR